MIILPMNNGLMRNSIFHLLEIEVSTKGLNFF